MAEQTFKVAVDWLTLATYSFAAYNHMVALLRTHYHKWKPGKVMQYSGFRDGPVWYGHGTQTDNREHYLVRVSGSAADDLTRIMADVEDEWIAAFYATRLDLQRTIPRPADYEPTDVHYFMRNEKSKTSVCSIIESPTGTTLYMGNRSSKRFTRIYDKQYEKPYLRLEIELKQEYAKITWGWIMNDGCLVIPKFYQRHLNQLPLPEHILQAFSPQVEIDIDIKTTEKMSTEYGQLKWLRSLIPKFNAMANSHEIGQQVQDIFYSLWRVNQ